MKQIPLEIEPQSAITKDNVIVQIDEAIKYHVTDVRAFVYENENSVVSMIQDAQSNLRGIIGKMDLNEVLNGTEEINVALFTSIKDITAGYGLAIDRINIGEIKVIGGKNEVKKVPILLFLLGVWEPFSIVVLNLFSRFRWCIFPKLFDDWNIS